MEHRIQSAALYDFPTGITQQQPSTSGRRNEAVINRRRRLPLDTAVADRSEAASRRWSRARKLAAKVGKGLSQNDKAEKLAREFLEAIDPWHRNGCNLHVYYVEWLHSRSEQPFFHWLEIGDGKDVDLLRCPRALLEKQRIKYLAPSEREAYEVTAKERKLIQKQTGEPLNTTGYGKWIFVLSPARVLYVGLKKKGEFHHSSFLAGAPIIASGRLVVHSGTLMAVWPVSSSYQHMERNFREFISFSKENNLDLTKTVFYPESVITDYSAALNHTTINSSINIESEWVFLFVGLVLEILLVAMDQCATPSKPHYSLVAVVASFATILTCLMELSYKARKEGVKIWRQGMKFGFLYPPPTHRPFFSFVDIFGFVSAFTQFILSLVAYSFYRRHEDSPIKLSIVSLIFILCMVYSRLTRGYSSRSEGSLELV